MLNVIQIRSYHPPLHCNFSRACFHNLLCVATFGLAQLYTHGKTLDEGQMKPTGIVIIFPICLFFKKYQSYLLARGFICRQIAPSQTSSHIKEQSILPWKDQCHEQWWHLIAQWTPQGWLVALSAMLCKGRLNDRVCLLRENPKPLRAWLVLLIHLASLLILFDGCKCSENCQLFVRLCWRLPNSSNAVLLLWASYKVGSAQICCHLNLQ